jgi:hypothetical protein
MTTLAGPSLLSALPLLLAVAAFSQLVGAFVSRVVAGPCFGFYLSLLASQQMRSALLSHSAVILQLRFTLILDGSSQDGVRTGPGRVQ